MLVVPEKRVHWGYLTALALQEISSQRWWNLLDLKKILSSSKGSSLLKLYRTSQKFHTNTVMSEEWIKLKGTVMNIFLCIPCLDNIVFLENYQGIHVWYTLFQKHIIFLPCISYNLCKNTLSRHNIIPYQNLFVIVFLLTRFIAKWH